MKEDRRRHKQLETRFDEDHGGEESTAASFMLTYGCQSKASFLSVKRLTVV